MQTIDPSSSNLHIHNKLSKILKPDNSMFELIVIIFVADSPETDSFVLDDCDCKFCCPDHSHSFETDIFYVGWLSEIFLFVVGTHLTMAIVSTSQNSALLQEQRKVLSCCDLGNVVDWDQDWNRWVLIASDAKLAIDAVSKAIAFAISHSDNGVAPSTTDIINIAQEPCDRFGHKCITLGSCAKLSIDTFAPSKDFVAAQGTHVMAAWTYLRYFGKIRQQNWRIRVIGWWWSTQSPIDIATHHVDVSIETEETWMIGSTHDLLYEYWKHYAGETCELLTMLVFACSWLSVLVRTNVK